MAAITVAGDTSGSVTLQAPAVAGSTVLTLPVATDTLVGKATTDTLTNKTLGSGLVAGASLLTSGTAQASTSGTSIDFTGIPSWAKRINVLLKGVSLSGASGILVQLGSGSVTTSGYLSTATRNGSASAVILSTSGFPIYSASAPEAASAAVTISLISTNNYICNYSGANYAASVSLVGGGEVSLSGALDRVRITSVNGTDTFDAGSINIMYE